ncbi:MAG: hypothetical protein PGN30_10305 [Mycolicibacterium neoaurum]|uniref:hypothetical protein n=1 Tax=Mycolicibacterium neoaurum TaxID=1795 RepID=UPI002FF739CC
MSWAEFEGRDDSQPPFPSGFGEEFDRAAWDHARAVGRAHREAFNRRHDRFMGAVMGVLLVPMMTVGTVLLTASNLVLGAAVFGVLTVVTAVCSFGMFRGWGYR